MMRIIPHFWRVFASDLRRATMSGAPAQYGIMVMLAKAPHCLSELAEALMVSLPTISKGVNHLEDRGLVTRQRDPSDRRRVYVALTGDGQETLKVVAEMAEARLLDIMGAITDKECETMLEGLQIMRKLQVSCDAPPGPTPGMEEK